MSETTLVQVRLDADVKKQASELFDRLGMNLSDAIRIFLTQAIIDQGMPFRPHIPNEETIESFKELENGGGERFSTPEEVFEKLGI